MPGKLPIGEPGESLSDDSSPNIPDRREELEYDRLETDVEILKSFKNEIDQRIIIKKRAMIVGITVMCLFFAVLACAIHSVNCMQSEFMMKNVAVAIALIVAPIVSITAIAITFFIGAFRKFDDRDIRTAGLGLAEAAKKASVGI